MKTKWNRICLDLSAEFKKLFLETRLEILIGLLDETGLVCKFLLQIVQFVQPLPGFSWYSIVCKYIQNHHGEHSICLYMAVHLHMKAVERAAYCVDGNF